MCRQGTTDPFSSRAGLLSNYFPIPQLLSGIPRGNDEELAKLDLNSTIDYRSMARALPRDSFIEIPPPPPPNPCSILDRSSNPGSPTNRSCICCTNISRQIDVSPLLYYTSGVAVGPPPPKTSKLSEVNSLSVVRDDCRGAT